MIYDYCISKHVLTKMVFESIDAYHKVEIWQRLLYFYPLYTLSNKSINSLPVKFCNLQTVFFFALYFLNVVCLSKEQGYLLFDLSTESKRLGKCFQLCN